MNTPTDIERILDLLRAIEAGQQALREEFLARPVPADAHGQGYSEGYTAACTHIRSGVEALVAHIKLP